MPCCARGVQAAFVPILGPINHNRSSLTDDSPLEVVSGVELGSLLLYENQPDLVAHPPMHPREVGLTFPRLDSEIAADARSIAARSDSGRAQK
jgi:hypothetical protein